MIFPQIKNITDEEAQAFFKKHTFAQLKKQVEAEQIDHLLCEDESMIRAYQALQYHWFPRGNQRKVPTYGKHEGAKLFGAINYETGQVHHREEEKADTAAFIRFLQDILSAYPSGKIAMILGQQPDSSRDGGAAFFDGTSTSTVGLSVALQPKPESG